MAEFHLLPEVRRVETLQLTVQRGAEGNPKNPLRWVWLYYGLDGQLLACYDPINGPPDAFNSPAAPATPAESEYERARADFEVVKRRLARLDRLRRRRDW